MKTKGAWREHLREIVGASLDPTVYAVQWAHDARCMQRGANHRRVGAFASLKPVCHLWALVPIRK